MPRLPEEGSNILEICIWGNLETIILGAFAITNAEPNERLQKICMSNVQEIIVNVVITQAELGKTSLYTHTLDPTYTEPDAATYVSPL